MSKQTDAYIVFFALLTINKKISIKLLFTIHIKDYKSLFRDNILGNQKLTGSEAQPLMEH